MKKGIFLLAVLLLTVPAVLVQAQEGKDKKSLFIYQLFNTKGTNLPNHIVEVINDKFQTRLVELLENKYTLVNNDSVTERLNKMGKKQSLGCDDEQCINDVINASETDYFIYGSIKPGIGTGNYLFSVSLMYREEGDSIPRVNNKISPDITWAIINNGEKLQAFLDEKAGDLIKKIAGQQTQQAGSVLNVIKEYAAAFTGASVQGQFSSSEKMSLWYKLSKAGALNKTITLSHESGRDFDIFVYDGESQISKAESSALSETIDVLSMNSDTCYVKVSNYQGQGPFTLSMKSYVDPLTTAKWLSGQASGTFTSAAKDFQWYKMKKNDVIDKNFVLTNNAGQDFDLAIYDGKSKVVYGEFTTNPEIINTKGKYFNSDIVLIRVTNFQGSGNYTLKVEKYSFAPNAKWFSGSVMNGSFSSTNKEFQWYKLKRNDAVNAIFQLRYDFGADRDFDFTVYDGEMKIASAESTSNPETLSLQGKNLNSDTCYIQVKNYKGSGNYTLTKMASSGTYTQQPYSGTQQPYSGLPNGSKAAARVESKMFISGFFPTSSRVDQWFRLTGQEGTNPEFAIFHATNADFDFEVYSNDNKVCTAMGSSSGDKVRCHVPGTCYLKVWNHNGSGSFTINISK